MFLFSIFVFTTCTASVLAARPSKGGETLLGTYESIICECDKKHIKSVYCGTSAVNEFVNAGTIRFSTAKVLKDIDVNMVIFKQHLTTFKPFLMNTTVNFCSMVKNRKNNFLINMALESFKNANIWNGCPLDGNYYLEKFYFGPNSTKHLPLPVGTYRVDSMFLFGDKAIMKVQVFIKMYKTRKQVNM